MTPCACIAGVGLQHDALESGEKFFEAIEAAGVLREDRRTIYEIDHQQGEIIEGGICTKFSGFSGLFEGGFDCLVYRPAKRCEAVARDGREVLAVEAQSADQAPGPSTHFSPIEALVPLKIVLDDAMQLFGQGTRLIAPYRPVPFSRFGHVVRDDFFDELLLAAEVIMNVRCRRADLVGDIAKTGVVKTVPNQEFGRDFLDRVTHSRPRIGRPGLCFLWHHLPEGLLRLRVN